MQTTSGASPVTAIRASLAAPKAPPCSPSIERCSGIFSAAAMMPIQTREQRAAADYVGRLNVGTRSRQSIEAVAQREGYALQHRLRKKAEWRA